MKLTRQLALIIVTVAVLAIMGWIYDIALFKSVNPDWVTMKFTTAISFILTGLTIISLSLDNRKNSNTKNWFVFITSFMLALLMLVLIGNVIAGEKSGIEIMFFDEENPINTVTPGIPSLGTMLAFLIIAIAGMATIFTKKITYLKPVGKTLIAISSIAIVGYLINAPALYYYAEYSTGMAIHTAVLFFIIGLTFTRLGNENNNKK